MPGRGVEVCGKWTAGKGHHPPPVKSDCEQKIINADMPPPLCKRGGLARVRGHRSRGWAGAGGRRSRLCLCGPRHDLRGEGGRPARRGVVLGPGPHGGLTAHPRTKPDPTVLRTGDELNLFFSFTEALSAKSHAGIAARFARVCPMRYTAQNRPFRLSRGGAGGVMTTAHHFGGVGPPSGPACGRPHCPASHRSSGDRGPRGLRRLAAGRGRSRFGRGGPPLLPPRLLLPRLGPSLLRMCGAPE